MIARKHRIRQPRMPPNEATRRYSSTELAIAEKLHRQVIVGSSEQVASRHKELAKSLELDELVVVTWIYDPAPRHRFYELLAEAFGMAKTGPHSVSSSSARSFNNQCGHYPIIPRLMRGV